MRVIVRDGIFARLAPSEVSRWTKELTPIAAHSKIVNSISYSPDGLTIVSGSDDGSVSIWNAKTGAELWTVKGTKPVTSVSFSSDGSRVIVGGEDGIRMVRVER